MNNSTQESRKVVENQIIEEIKENEFLLESSMDLDPLMAKIGDAKYVLLGEASHGTHEYYTWRTQITKRLILEKGFSFIAVEGDWPDCYRINRYIKGYDMEEKTANDVLKKFNRWPTWMWANWEIVALTEWLRAHNEGLFLEETTAVHPLLVQPDDHQMPETYPWGD